MKMLLAIINSDDSRNVMNIFMKSGFSITKLASTGGFLHTGNVTILVGLEDGRIDEAFEILRTHCQKRSQMLPTASSLAMGLYPTMPVEVEVGGATVFVLDVERFEKL